MKNVFKGIMILGLMVIGMFIGGKGAEAKEVPNRIITESTDNYYVEPGDRIEEYTNGYIVYYSNGIVECFDNDNNTVSYNDVTGDDSVNILDTYYKADESQITEYTNGSYAYVNYDNNTYEFCPVELGDWNYSCNSIDELNNLILSYKATVEGNNTNMIDNTFYSVNSYTDAYGDTVIEYNDNSYVVLNNVNNHYVFCPAITEDWALNFNSIENLNNCIATYKNIKEYGWY